MKDSLNYIGLGYVVEDKIEDKTEIKVYPVELIPTAMGDINVDEDITSELKNVLGDDISVVVNKSTYLTADWLNEGNNNRITAPDVCKGEIVKLFNMGEDLDYQWSTLFTKPMLRKREKLIIYLSNKASIEDEEDLSKGYFLLIDSINKKTIFHMSDNDGEFTSYDVSVDGKIGSFLIKDGRSNKIELVSHQDSLDVKMGKNVNITCGADANITTTGNTNVTAGGEVVVKAPKIKLN